MKKPDIVDAEFEVISPAASENPTSEPKWNGLGLPPQWGEWGWFARLAFLVTYAVLAWWGLMFAIWLRSIVPLLVHP